MLTKTTFVLSAGAFLLSTIWAQDTKLVTSGQAPSTQAPAASGSGAELAALQTKLKALELQKQIEGLQAQKLALENQEAKSTAPLTTDAKLAAVQSHMKALQLQMQIDALKGQQAALLNPPAQAAPAPAAPATPATAAPPAKPISPKDAELKQLEEERQELLKQQEIDRRRRENAVLAGGPVTAPPPTQTPQANAPTNCKPKVGVKIPKKPSAWACKTLGVCADDTPVPVSGGCPSGPVNGQGK